MRRKSPFLGRKKGGIMKLSKQLIERLRAAMDEFGMCKMDIAKALGLSHTTVGRWFSGAAKNITDETVERISSVLKIPIHEMTVLSLGGMPKPVGLVPRRMPVEESKSADVYDHLAKWLRTSAPPKVKAAVFSTAEIGGFRDTALPSVQNALRTASTPDDDCDEMRSA
jgi:transcriptional regulator with XRE-family HTH domain